MEHPVNPPTSRDQLPLILRKIKLIIFYIFTLTPPHLFGQWTDPVLSPRVTTIKAVHITELRTQINSKLILCGQPTQVWTEPILIAKTTKIKKAHIDELRTGAIILVNAYLAQQGLPRSSLAFTDSIITARLTPIKLTHIQEIRDYVASANCSNCPAQVLSWSVGTDSCSGMAASTNVGSATTVNDSATPNTGSAQFSCNSGGTWASTPNVGATCNPYCQWNTILYLGNAAPQDPGCNGSPGPTGDGTPTAVCGVSQSGNIKKCCDTGADCFRYRCDCL